MANAYELAKQDLEAGLAKAAEQNVDGNVYGQAMIWQVLQHYHDSGRSVSDIKQEVEFTLEELNEDGIFHVVRN